jgi:hypothetical protein
MSNNVQDAAGHEPSSEGPPENPTLLSAVPYVLTLFSTFLTGLLFVVINAPLLPDSIHGNTCPDFGALIDKIQSAYGALASLSAKNFTLALMLLLPVAYAIQQLSAAIAMIVGEILNIFKSWLFTPLSFMKRPQNRRLWGCKPGLKQEWEWEFFNYCIYWGLFTNCLIFLFLVRRLLGRWPILLLPILAFQVGLAIARSRVMYLVHEECLPKDGKTTHRAVAMEIWLVLKCLLKRVRLLK